MGCGREVGCSREGRKRERLAKRRRKVGGNDRENRVRALELDKRQTWEVGTVRTKTSPPPKEGKRRGEREGGVTPTRAHTSLDHKKEEKLTLVLSN